MIDREKNPIPPFPLRPGELFLSLATKPIYRLRGAPTENLIADFSVSDLQTNPSGRVTMRFGLCGLLELFIYRTITLTWVFEKKKNSHFPP